MGGFFGNLKATKCKNKDEKTPKVNTFLQPFSYSRVRFPLVFSTQLLNITTSSEFTIYEFTVLVNHCLNKSFLCYNAPI